MISHALLFYYALLSALSCAEQESNRVDLCVADSLLAVDSLAAPPPDSLPVFGAGPTIFTPGDTTKSRIKQRKDREGDASHKKYETPFVLPQPDNVKTTYELSEDGKGYYIYEKVGDKDVRPPSYITKEEFQALRKRLSNQEFFRSRARSAYQTGSGGGSGGGLLPIPGIKVNNKLFESVFGSNKVDIKPNVSVLLDFAVRNNTMQNPSLTLAQQSNTTFNFNQQIQMNVIGSIGEKLKLRVNYDTQATFSFENQFKINYEGREDDIIKKIEAGNVSMPLNGSLITGGQNLWGVKLAMQFGPVFVTTLASMQRGQSNEMTISAGSQQTPFEKKIGEYDENRHFFLSQFFRQLFEQSLQNLPQINALININRVEIWRTNRSSAQVNNTRNAVGFVDLGESDATKMHNQNLHPRGGARPSNNANQLYQNVTQIPDARERSGAVAALTDQLNLTNNQDFEIVEQMQRMEENRDYTINRQLGYVSLNQRLQPNDALFVAFEYTFAGQTQVFKVGEFALDVAADANNTNVLFLKLIKPSSMKPGVSPLNPNGTPYPAWDLMMKNVYSVGSGSIKSDGFNLEIVYESTDGSGDINFLPTGPVKNTPLIQVFDLDRLTNNSELGPDNKFDFIPNATVIPDKGLVMFPVLEPFGKHLEEKLQNNPQDVTLYSYDPLYRFTQQDAIQYYQQLNRFKFRGKASSAAIGSEINLNAVQIAQGSIRVTSGGTQLTEGTDYSVDYQVGKITLMNPAILTSGQDVKVKWESNQLFGMDQKTLVGARVDYKPLKDLALGTTIMYLNERPLIRKINVGAEPISNIIWGLDVGYRKESRFISTLLDKLPFYNTKTNSEITFNGEFAQLIPRKPTIDAAPGEVGVAYIDDFEGARNTVDMMGMAFWKLGSTPSAFPSYNSRDLNGGYKRAKIAWYMIDPMIFDQRAQFKFDEKSPAINYHYSRRCDPQEVFPNRTITAGLNLLTTFDVHYEPRKRGQYNFNPDLNNDGTLKNPRDNYGAIMRRTTGNTDFEAANFEFIEFWVMDPFLDNPNHKGGDVYINLGKISEDVLSDGVRSYENGLPTSEAASAAATGLERTHWARVPQAPVPTNSFDNSPTARPFQDVGLDGLRSADEPGFYQQTFLDKLPAGLDPAVRNAINADPSNDDYLFFRDEQPDLSPNDPLNIIKRYSKYNGLDGNSPINQPGQSYTRTANPNPDVEDINADNSVNTIEAYYEYKVSMRKQDLVIGRNFVVDKREQEVTLPNQDKVNTRWYLFRVPVRNGNPVGAIQDFKAVDFIRLYLTDFEDDVTLRFGKFDMVATQWRTYLNYLGPEGEDLSGSDPSTTFEIATLNVEENGKKQPFNYVVPPYVNRQAVVASPNPNQLMNEQTLVLRGCNLVDGDARAAFRTLNFDLRNYGKLKLWVHAENVPNVAGYKQFLHTGDLRFFVRIGSDLTNNYYDYELPLKPSDPTITGDPNDLAVRENVWANNVEIDFKELVDAKDYRNAQADANVPNVSFSKPFAKTLSDGRRVIVVGNPQLNNTKNMLVGVRNPADDKQPMCVEVWVNEVRVTDFNTQSGYAANGRVNVKLADLGNVSVSGAMSTPYFGGIDKRINERSLDNTVRYDIAATLQLGMLLPKKIGIEIPFYMTYGERMIKPRYNPLDPDITLAQISERTNNTGGRVPDVVTYSTDYQRTYSYSFTNVRKIYVNPKTKKRFWHPQNFTFTYGYSDRFSRNAQIEYWKQLKWDGAIGYNYGLNPKKIQPFKNVKGFRLLSEFNFFLLPRTVAARFDGTRAYDEQKLRAVSRSNSFQTIPTFQQNFTLNRTYSFRWDLTQSLGVSYTATNQSRVDELAVRDRKPGETLEEFKARQNEMLGDRFLTFGKENTIDTNDIFMLRRRTNLINFGRTTSFNQSVNFTYRLPFDKIKPVDWISASLNYNAAFRWQANALQNIALGNTVSNTRTMGLNGQLNMANLYKKFPGIAKLLKPIPKKTIVSLADSTRKEGDYWPVFFKRTGQVVLGWVVSIQSVDFNYSRNQGTTLPGYLPQTDNFGFDFNYGYDAVENGVVRRRSSTAPGAGFILGEQPSMTPNGWLGDAKRYGWISSDPRMLTPFSTTDNSQFTARTSLTLFKGFKVDLNAERQTSANYSALFGFNDSINDFALSNRTLNGSLSMSYFALGTAFEGTGEVSPTFNKFSENRHIISNRLRDANYTPEGVSALGNAVRVEGTNASINGYWNGYTGKSQDVLIPAFLSSYGASNVNTVDIKSSSSAFPKIPFPNWTINYNGLSDLDLFKDLFKTITIRSSYRATYTSNYNLNLNAVDLRGTTDPTNTPFSNRVARVDTGWVAGSPGAPLTVYNFQSIYNIQTISINEQFSPLLGINLNWKNGITTTIDVKRTRMVTLNVGQMQVVENKSTEFTFNVMWRKDKFLKPLVIFGKAIELKNTLTARFEMSIRSNRMQNRQLDSQNPPTPTGGNLNLTIKPSIDYMINSQLTVKAYVEYNRNTPALSTSFPTSFTAVGVQVQFNLTN